MTDSILVMGNTTPTDTLGVFKVDLIFSRNKTYIPQPLLPIVFALQNPPLASTLAVTISWNL
ncbi:hypothetical protein BO86DRAFT_133504 [Aspergillus japonicus CBS 114.51]|nr:hypothetical protein BO86DRAFT_133504 [Aspergillus japonicus CBS 114.51]RAH80196.1 hypothetical protein BO86DRAFT_133504 [Aspergillus japonicus CBS 114.51]